MKLLRMIANLGYGSRREVTALFREGRITDADGAVLYADDRVEHAQVRVDGEPLDPPHGLAVMLHKPLGYVCSTRGVGPLVPTLLPPRWRARDPALSMVGRLDRDSTGLLLLTDDGALLHRIISPRAQVTKVYEVELAQDLRGYEGELFAAGTLMLESESTPLLPATMTALGPRQARIAITEGRYHQVRRMFAVTGNSVVALHRSAIGALQLGDLPAGELRILTADDITQAFAPPKPS
jgi:16S rRNA pseudouridine516 synthase